MKFHGALCSYTGKISQRGALNGLRREHRLVRLVGNLAF